MIVSCARCEADYRIEAYAECPCCGCKDIHFICQKHKLVYHTPGSPNEYTQCPFCEQDELAKAKQS